MLPNDGGMLGASTAEAMTASTSADASTSALSKLSAGSSNVTSRSTKRQRNTLRFIVKTMDAAKEQEAHRKQMALRDAWAEVKEQNAMQKIEDIDAKHPLMADDSDSEDDDDGMISVLVRYGPPRSHLCLSICVLCMRLRTTSECGCRSSDLVGLVAYKL